MSVNTREIEKINEQIRLLKSSPLDFNEEIEVLDGDSSDVDDILDDETKKIENLSEFNEIKKENSSDIKNDKYVLDASESDINKNSVDDDLENKSFWIYYIIVIILLIILMLLLYFLFK